MSKPEILSLKDILIGIVSPLVLLIVALLADKFEEITFPLIFIIGGIIVGLIPYMITKQQWTIHYIPVVIASIGIYVQVLIKTGAIVVITAIPGILWIVNPVKNSPPETNSTTRIVVKKTPETNSTTWGVEKTPEVTKQPEGETEEILDLYIPDSNSFFPNNVSQHESSEKLPIPPLPPLPTKVQMFLISYELGPNPRHYKEILNNYIEWIPPANYTKPEHLTPEVHIKSLKEDDFFKANVIFMVVQEKSVSEEGGLINDAEENKLREYSEHGGVLFIDSESSRSANMIKKELCRVFKRKYQREEVPPKIYTNPFDLSKSSINIYNQLQSMLVNEQFAIILSQEHLLQKKPEDDVYKFITNLLIYSLELKK